MDSQQLLDIADRCVKCGLCLPRCPTYQLTRDEGESPRGRIALIQGVLSGALQSEQVAPHLERCLLCRRCEGACPSGVPYGELLEGFRRQAPPRSSGLTARLATLGVMQPALWIYQRSGLQAIGERIAPGRLKRLQQMLPRLKRPRTPTGDYPAMAEKQGRIGLLTGCVGRLADQNAILAAISLLRQLGFEVVVPSQQGCCGALAHHAGDRETAEEQARHNQQLFAGLGVDAVVGLASGCLAYINDYPRIGIPAKPPVVELGRFLDAHCDLSRLTFSPSEETLWLHSPCSLEQLAGSGASVARLLRHIPGIAIHELAGYGCCGSAGSYMLNQPEMAQRLRSPLIEQIREQLPGGGRGILLTSNSGCAMHLRQGLREAQLPVEVMHPVELLWRQLQRSK